MATKKKPVPCGIFYSHVHEDTNTQTHISVAYHIVRKYLIIQQIGYRDGLISGKEASAQEGFDIGFRESVLVGYNWGLVRGVTGYVLFFFI